MGTGSGTIRRVLAGASLAAAALLGSCSDATDPGPGGGPPPDPVAITYSPADSALVVETGAAAAFAVDVLNADSVRCLWTVAGGPAGEGPRFTYRAAAAGVDTVAVAVRADDEAHARCWVVTVPRDPVAVSFAPADTTLALLVTGTADFAVTVLNADSVRCLWSVDGAEAGAGPTFAYAPAGLGVAGVAVAVTADGTVHGRRWLVDAAPDPAALPRPVAALAAADGPAAGEVALTWRRPDPTGAPVAGYELKVRYDGPLDATSWEAAALLEDRPAGAETDERAVYGPADGLAAGAKAWFGIRVRDAWGQLSAIAASGAHVVSFPWSFAVAVQDDAGRPLAGANVHYGGPLPAVTGADGTVTIGPLASWDEVDVVIDTPLYDVWPQHLTVAGQDTTLRFVLLNRYEPDHVDCGLNDPEDFLELFRLGTLTSGRGGRSTRLWKWERYPLAVWIPEARSPRLGWDLRALASAALGIWNDALGETYLVAAPDSQSADVEFSFRPLPGYNGYTTVVEPWSDIGLAIPRRMRLDVELHLDDAPVPKPVWITEVALHELGHALGFYGHLCGTGRGNLMDWGGAIGSLADGPEHAVSPDEMRTVRAVRRLPQGFDVAGWADR